MQSTNIEIRQAAKDNGVNLWQVAEAMKVSDITLSRRMRHELSTEDKKRILSIINEIAAAGAATSEG